MKRTNCAIYTRKSSDEGLEQEFNSLDAQREACEAYIKSQKHEGWVCLPAMYDDGGLSGGTMERPALRRLLADIQSGKVHTFVVYKVDRLTRSLADFAKIVDVLDAAGASFVSVTQQFNTTTSMGRLTLNMLLSFAQFEREIAGERIRDKVAASKAKGMWMGGNVPLGYDAVDKKLIVNAAEADDVRTIFRTYLQVRSVLELRVALDRLGTVSKRREGANGTLAGGKRFSRGALYTLLQNPIYAGQVGHQGKHYPGQHERIVDENLWRDVQDLLVHNRNERSAGTSANAPSLLAGVVADSDGQSMTATHANKRGKRYRYYVSKSLITKDEQPGPSAIRVPAGELENLVIIQLSQLCSSRTTLVDALGSLNLDARQTERALLCVDSECASTAYWNRERVRTVVKRVAVATNGVTIDVNPAGLAIVLIGEVLEVDQEPQPISIAVDAQLSSAGKGKRIVIENEGVGVDPALVQLLRDAHAMRTAVIALDGDPDGETAWHTTYRARRIALIRLSYLAPKVVKTILSGRQPPELSAKRLMVLSKDLPYAWAEQLGYLGVQSV
jgi:site-specific DNA recombinase